MNLSSYAVIVVVVVVSIDCAVDLFVDDERTNQRVKDTNLYMKLISITKIKIKQTNKK